MAFNNTDWAKRTYIRVCELTPEIKGKAFDPDWFTLGEHFQEAENEINRLRSELAKMSKVDTVNMYKSMHKTL